MTVSNIVFHTLRYVIKSTQKKQTMKQLFTTLFVLVASLAGFGQDKNFDLSKYKFPDYKRHELELNLNSSGYGRKSKTDSPEYLNNGVNTNYVSSFYNAQSNAGLNYSYYFLNRKRIDYLQSSFSGNYSYSSSTNASNKLKDLSQSIDLTLTGSRTLYLRENKLFLEGMSDFRFYQDNSKNKVDTQLQSKYFTSNLNLLVGVGVGNGRMEMVSDLWQAHYILEKLKKEKILSKELTNENVFEFAYLSSRLKNKRFFDARLRKIAELESLDSLLHNQGLVNDSDIRYFTQLNDYWSYGNFQERKSGRVLKFWISPEYTRMYNKTSGNNSMISNKISLNTNVSYNCIKQLNLYWERWVNFSLSHESVIDISGRYYNSYRENNFNPNLSFGYGFFPDSRTSISGYLGYDGQNLFVSNTTTVMPKLWINSIYFDFTGYYYISPQLQITGSLRLSYSDKGYNTTKNIYNQYNLGLRYAIF
jgi:hypothetical protein